MLTKKTLFSIFIITALIISSMTSVKAQDPNLPDTVYIDSAVSNSFNRGIVPVYFSNDEQLGGLEITLVYNSLDVSVDSFSFVGGRVESFSKWVVQLADNYITIHCIPLDASLIPAGTGLLGNFYFSYASSILPQVVPIDSITLVHNGAEYSTSFSDINATNFKPVFVSGYLDIQPTSCCLGDRGNVDNSSDDLVDVTDLVYMVNFMFGGMAEPVCLEEANIDGSEDGVIDISDLVYLINYMFGGGTPPPSCF